MKLIKPIHLALNIYHERIIRKLIDDHPGFYIDIDVPAALRGIWDIKVTLQAEVDYETERAT